MEAHDDNGEKVVIVGGPRVGKTTLAQRLAAPRALTPRSTDSIIGKAAWSDDSKEVAGWFDGPGPFVVEGVTAARALRKWLATHRKGKPCDRVIVLDTPRVPRTRGQEIMAKGCASVFNEIARELQRRGVVVERAN